MVSRMEGRVEQVETNLTGVREDVRKLEGWFQEMTETLARIEAQGRTMMAEASPSQTRSSETKKREAMSTWPGKNMGKKFRELQLPVFEGEDPLGWIYRVERYFAVNEISEAERLQAASVSLEGKTLNWIIG
uniref:Putative ovule protein n=2 Tax=Solanum chacoense TaxID=4108 RepID=A0A0V0ITS5_SOLCH